MLRRAVFKHGGKKWKTIATFFQNKTPNQCNQRWNELQNHGSAVKKPWCPSEDMRMIDLVKTHGPGKWAVIASYLPGRNGKQCRERWHNQLNPAIKKGPWTVEEDEIIMEMQLKYGNRWAKITEKLPGRTDNAVKNHWHSSMKAKVKRASSPTTALMDSSPPLLVEASSGGPLLNDNRDQLEIVPMTPTPAEPVAVKLEPGSLSPDSVAMCPSHLEPALQSDQMAFSLNDRFSSDDEDECIASPGVTYDSQSSTSEEAGDSDVSSIDYDESIADDDILDDVFDGLDDEALVLSTDPEYDARRSRAGSLPVDPFDDRYCHFCEAIDNASNPNESAFEPHAHDAELIASLELAGDDQLHAELLEVLSEVAMDNESMQIEPITPPPPSPCSPPTTGLFAAEWDASMGGLSPSSPLDQDVVEMMDALASIAPATDAARPPAAPFTSLADHTLHRWLGGASGLPPAQPPEVHDDDELALDDSRLVWDVMYDSA